MSRPIDASDSRIEQAAECPMARIVTRNGPPGDALRVNGTANRGSPFLVSLCSETPIAPALPMQPAPRATIRPDRGSPRCWRKPSQARRWRRASASLIVASRPTNERHARARPWTSAAARLTRSRAGDQERRACRVAPLSTTSRERQAHRPRTIAGSSLDSRRPSDLRQPWRNAARRLSTDFFDRGAQVHQRHGRIGAESDAVSSRLAGRRGAALRRIRRPTVSTRPTRPASFAIIVFKAGERVRRHRRDRPSRRPRRPGAGSAFPTGPATSSA